MKNIFSTYLSRKFMGNNIFLLIICLTKLLTLCITPCSVFMTPDFPLRKLKVIFLLPNSFILYIIENFIFDLFWGDRKRWHRFVFHVWSEWHVSFTLLAWSVFSVLFWAHNPWYLQWNEKIFYHKELPFLYNQ